ncbi:MAG TPA: hypothetical protein VJL28_02110 [Gemmatimonadaceae bacterium]|nr:hypothetical protein [Gemmatimonadaceae bacterium]
MPARRKKIRGTYCERKEAPKSRFDKRSFRWKKSGKSWILIGCPRGKWNAKTERCKVGTRAHKIMTKAPKGACPVGRKVRKG